MKVIVFEGSHTAGKSTIIKYLCEKYNFKPTKSVPDWFRKYIPFVREQKMNYQKSLYFVAHDIMFKSNKEANQNVVMDRWKYTTIIRLCYENGLDKKVAINEILKLQNNPDLVILIKVDAEIAKSRLLSRDNITEFDAKFYAYESEIFDALSLKKPNLFKIVYNNVDFNTFYDKVDKILIENNIFTEKQEKEK